MGRIVDLEQNTADWLRWREAGIGASDAATILGMNPYEDDFSLFLKKTGQKKDKPMRDQPDGRPDPRAHGLAFEAEARDAAMAETDLLLAPVCMEHTDLPWMRASFDGFDEDAFVGIEIKCPQDIREHLVAREGRVPELYYPQIQHQIAVAMSEQDPDPRAATRKMPKWGYFSYWHETAEGRLLWVEADPVFINRMIEAECKFWVYLQARNFPLPEGERKIEEPDADLLADIERWTQGKQMVEEAQRYEFEARTRLLRRMDGAARLRIADQVELTRIYVKGYEVNRPYSVAPRIDFRARRLK